MMFPRLYRQGWIHGLPGYEAPGGIPVDVVQFTSPKVVKENWFRALYSGLLRFLGLRLRTRLSATELNFTILAAPEVREGLEKLADIHETISRLSFVVRMDAAKELDDEYQMGGAKIESVLPVEDPVGAMTVKTLFDNITSRLRMSSNPGSPADAPEVQRMGVNKGWLFTRESSDPEKGESLDVVDFTPPVYDGKLEVHLGKPCTVMEKLARSRTRKAELILVLPERDGRRYQEFKLWDAKVVEAGELKTVFESSYIEWMTG